VNLQANPLEIARTYRLLIEPGSVCEVRIPKTRASGTIAGFFDRPEPLIKAVVELREPAPGTYVTINPVNKALLARAKNRLQMRIDTTTSDRDILGRRWLPIDIDPQRPSGISATDEEHEAALNRACEIRFTLSEEGWPQPILASSGNGSYLLYAIALPNDQASEDLIKRVLKALAARFDDSAVRVDQSLFNASRIVKLFGSIARKGDNIPERPHRLSKILNAPSAIEPVPRELLEELAATIKDPDPPRPASSAGRGRFNIDDFIARYLKAGASEPYEGGRRWRVDCPFDESHRSPDAAVFERPNGSLAFKCFHNSCTGKGWRDVRELFEGPRPQQQQPKESDATEIPGLPAFPEKAWRGVFSEYRAAMQGTTEACDVAHFATLWSAAGTALERKVSMISGDTIYPNTYLAVFGGTNDKKTTSQRRIRSCRLLEHHPQIKMVCGVGSTEGLAQDLTDAGTGTYLFVWEEFASLLSRARWTGSTLLEFITETFDCPDEWTIHYKKNSIHLDRPTPSILTATTPEWFWKYARAEDFFGGFGNRFLFLSGKKKDPLPNPKEINGEIISRVKDQLKIMAGHNPRRAEWTEGAGKIWNDFYVDFESQNREGLLGAGLKRAHVYVRKLAMTYSALEDTLPYVHRDQLEAAIAVVRYGAQCAEKLIEMQAVQSRPQGELEQRFLKWIAAHEGERVRTLQQRMWKYCGDSELFNRVFRSLLQADRIEFRDRRVYLSS
jgi:hypothetical protein